MTIDCDHWNAGVCTLGRYGGRPSPGTCNVCKLRTGEPVDLKAIIPEPAIPLAGDLLQAAFKKFGAERFAKWFEKVSGVACGCVERREKLNALDAKLRRRLGLA